LKRIAKIKETFMKKVVALVFIALIIVSCGGTPPASPPPSNPTSPPDVENPNRGPNLQVSIPPLFSPNPDIENRFPIAIAVTHPVLPLKDWSIRIREGDGTASFFTQSGQGNPPVTWTWNGKGTSGRLVESATDYPFELTVSDSFDNKGTYEGIIAVDIIVRRDGDGYRINVPSIIFPANSSDLRRVTQAEQNSNARVMGMIAKSLNKFPDYTIIVEGHANPTTPPGTVARVTEEAGTGGVMGLVPLSDARAKAVVDYLVANEGISRNRLRTLGIGGTRTIAAYDDDKKKKKNRRVEFLLVK
jgi:outer membrane protein OmpA-like peptidoglycan-associated protein